jgi:CHAT domain-containing protein
MKAAGVRVRVVALNIAVLAVAACDSGVATTDTRTANASSPELTRLLAQGDSIYRQSSDSAAVIWTKALELARSVNDSVAIARALTGLGQAARLRLDLTTSRTLGEQALALKLRLGMRTELSRSYNALGLLAWYEGRPSDAITLYQRASEAAKAVGDSAAMARAVINTGNAQRDLGDLGAARASLERGRDAVRAAGDSLNLGRALTSLAGLEILLGDPIGAIASLESARRLFRATADSLGEVNAIGQLATAYEALGEPQRAFAALDSAIAMAARRDFKKEEAEDLKLLGDFFAEAGDHRRALDYYARATKAIDSLDLPEERGNLLRNQARSHAALGRADLANRYARDALAIHRAGGFQSAALNDLVALARFAQAAGDARAAQGYVESAKQVATRLDSDRARGVAALAEARLADAAGESQRVLRVLTAARTFVDVPGPSSSAEAAALRMRAYARTGNLEAAAASGRQSIESLERVRGNYGSGELRTSFASDRAAAYADLVLVLLRLGRTSEAMQVADGARGRALLEHISAARSELRSRPGPAQRALEADSLLRAIDALVSQLREKERLPLRERGTVFVSLTRGLADRLAEARTKYETLVARDPRETDALVLLGRGSRTTAEVQTRLQSDEALLEYFVTPAQLLVFVVRRDTVVVRPVNVTADDLFDRTRLARDLMSRPDSSGAERPVMRALFSTLVRPAQESGVLRGVRRLIIVRHAALTYLPFAALVDPVSGQRLIEQYSLLNAPSAAAVVALRTDARSSGTASRARAVAFAPMPLQLPASLREAMTLREAFPGAEPVVGGSATEQRVREALATAGVIHIATHGVMNARNPLFSRLELAPSARTYASDNGRLETHELLGLRIGSSLVFLSGCETGVGEAWSTTVDLGEDYTTLGQSLLFAGARNVIATLWRIDDEGAAELSRRFYRALGSVDPREALARSQREMAVDPRWGSPFYWAAFELIGDGLWSSAN